MSDASRNRVEDWLFRIMLAVAVGLSAWSLKTISALDRRVAVIEDTRFTREDARLNREEILASIGTPRWIEERLAVLAEQNSELKQQNRELAQQVQTLLYKLDAIERQLQARPAGVWIDRLGGWRLALTAIREAER